MTTGSTESGFCAGTGNRVPEPVGLHCVRTIQPGERVLIDVPGGGGVGPAFAGP